jgi:hypothetical protein
MINFALTVQGNSKTAASFLRRCRHGEKVMLARQAYAHEGISKGSTLKCNPYSQGQRIKKEIKVRTSTGFNVTYG